MVKHYAVYNVETNRNTSADDDVVSQRAEEEIYMPAFQAAVQAGVSSVMCAYSSPDGVPACQDPFLLGALDNQFGFQGFVTSDWRATQSSAPAALAGEDVDMPGDILFGADLSEAIPSQLPRAYLDGMVERVLSTMFEAGLFNRHRPGSAVANPTPADLATATDVAEEGTVLLKNSGHLLPLHAGSIRSVAVIGDDAGTEAFFSGGGSAYVEPSSTPVTPLAGIEAVLGKTATVSYEDSDDQAAAVAAAKRANVAIIFSGYYEEEGSDLATIDLNPEDSALITAVAKAQPHTIVVLTTGSAVTMPWLADVPAVVEQWYPGQVDGTAIAAVLFGRADPSGHLPVTFPTSLSHVPDPNAQEFPGANGQVDYAEGIDVGYRWYQANGVKPLFPFGFGLSYTTFSFSHLSVRGPGSSGVAQVQATVTNTGNVAGAEVAQLYVGDPPSTGEPPWQLKGFQRVDLAPGASARVKFDLPRHDFTYWSTSGTYSQAWPGTDGGGWAAPAGSYAIGVGGSSADLELRGSLRLSTAIGPDRVSVTGPGNQSTRAGDAVRLAIRAADSAPLPDLSYSAEALPGGLTIDRSTGVISGSPLDAGASLVTVTATDGEAYEGSTSFRWVVLRRYAPKV
jgi:beta-glucosidase